VCAGIFFIPDLAGGIFLYNKSYDYFDLGVLRTQLHWNGIGENMLIEYREVFTHETIETN
jgi:hypothetical protein